MDKGNKDGGDAPKIRTTRGPGGGPRPKKGSKVSNIWKGLEGLMEEMQEAKERMTERGNEESRPLSVAESFELIKGLEVEGMNQARKDLGEAFDEERFLKLSETYARYLRRRIGILQDPLQH